MANPPKDSVFSPEAWAILLRAMAAAEAAFRAEGLSRRAARTLVDLGYTQPAELFGVDWERRGETPGLRERAAAVGGCGPATLRELKWLLYQVW